MFSSRVFPIAIALLSICAVAIGVIVSQQAKVGIEITDHVAGHTPITSYQSETADKPLVVIAHGFSGSRRMVEAVSLELAHAGYHVASLDLPGHGNNPIPMSSNVTEIDGATVQLKRAIADVIDAEVARLNLKEKVALVGHSMSTDLVIRIADADPRIGPLISISMYSDLVSENVPPRMLIVSGEYEPGLRKIALDAVRMIDPGAEENEYVTNADLAVRRGAFVAPGVEHVGVLYSPVTLEKSVTWLNEEFGRETDDALQPISIGLPILLATFGAFFFFWPVTRALGSADASTRDVYKPIWLALFVPPILTPIFLIYFKTEFIPMIGMSYLAVHLAVYGLLSLALLWRAGIKPTFDGWQGPLLLIVYAIGIIGVLIDRLFTDFLPSDERLLPTAMIALGAVPFMIADCLLLKSRPVAWWVRYLARLLFIASIALALVLSPEGRLMIGFFMPVIIMFFLVFGTMARWLHAWKRSPTMLGASQGILLAYALGAIVPMISGSVG